MRGGQGDRNPLSRRVSAIADGVCFYTANAECSQRVNIFKPVIKALILESGFVLITESHSFLSDTKCMIKKVNQGFIIFYRTLLVTAEK